jgi:UDP-N-acetylmuramoylalanine--D-glutamate ligase
MLGAVTLAAGLARPGDCVLLSPACASTDMYRNFVERGEVFIKAVQQVLGS